MTPEKEPHDAFITIDGQDSGLFSAHMSGMKAMRGQRERPTAYTSQIIQLIG